MGYQLKLGLRFIFGLLLISSLLSSCAILKELISGGVIRPTVEVKSIKITSTSLSKVDVKVALSVNNPNDFDLKFNDLQYSLKVDDNVLASGNYTTPTNIPANLKTKIDLPISINISQVIDLLKQFLQKKDKIIAKWQASANFDSPIVGEINIKFEDKLPIE